MSLLSYSYSTRVLTEPHRFKKQGPGPNISVDGSSKVSCFSLIYQITRNGLVHMVIKNMNVLEMAGSLVLIQSILFTLRNGITKLQW